MTDRPRKDRRYHWGWLSVAAMLPVVSHLPQGPVVVLAAQAVGVHVLVVSVLLFAMSCSVLFYLRGVQAQTGKDRTGFGYILAWLSTVVLGNVILLALFSAVASMFTKR